MHGIRTADDRSDGAHYSSGTADRYIDLLETACVPEAASSYSLNDTEEEIRQRVKEILLKQDIGDDLTPQEETILAYAPYAADEQAVRDAARTGYRDR